MDAKELGAFIAEVRREKEMTQAELAERLHVTKSAVSKWERGAGLPDINMIEPLAESLEVSIIELMKHRRLSQKEISETDATETMKEVIVQTEKEKKTAILSWVIFVIIIALVMWCLTYLWRDVTELGGGMLWLFFFGGIGMLLPIIALITKKHVHLLSLGSFFCCGMVFVSELFYTAHKVHIHDLSAIYDTTETMLMYCKYIFGIIFILNLLAYFFTDKENQKALAQIFVDLGQSVYNSVLWVMRKF